MGSPSALCSRCRYAWQTFVTIPTSQQLGNVTFYTRLTGNYGSGATLCSDTSNVCTDVTPVTIGSNSSVVQQNLTTFSSVYLPLGVAIPSIIAIVLLVLYVRKPSP